jgi:hypothetical protein
VVLPGDLPADAVSRRRLGAFVPELAAVDDGACHRFCDDTAAVAWAGAALDLGCWRSRLTHADPGPELAALWDERPDILAPGAGRGNLLADQETRWADAVLASIQARARLIAHLQAAQYADVADLSANYPAAHEFLATEIALALSCTESAAQALLGTAEAFRDRLPQTLAALFDSTLDESRAFAIVAATTPVAPDIASRVEAAVLPGAGSVTATTVRRRAERAIIALDPDGAADRHHRRTKERYVSRWTESDGMGGLRVYSSAQDIATIHEALTVLANEITIARDGRDLGNRRVDALVELCAGALEDGRLSQRTCDGACAGGDTCPGGGAHVGTDIAAGKRRATPRTRPLIRVTMPITALIGGDEPCELDGHGPITAAQARMIAADATLTRLVCDPLSGTLLDYGLTRYDPPESLKRHIRARDRTCAMPGCSQPADRCDIDHVIRARPDPITGLPTLGATADGNLAPDCRHHHLAKDGNGGFDQRREPDGSYTWTTPLGREYRRAPEQLWKPGPREPGGPGERDPLPNHDSVQIIPRSAPWGAIAHPPEDADAAPPPYSICPGIAPIPALDSPPTDGADRCRY